jgi:hypothetical protein
MIWPSSFRHYRRTTVLRAALTGMQRRSRRGLLWLVIASLGATLGATQKAEAPAPSSKEPLTAEQIAIYRAVLIDYFKDSRQWLNLSNKTAPLRLSGPSATGGCDPGFDLETIPSPTSPPHAVDPRVARGLKVTLVDAAGQLAKIRKSDPHNPASDGGDAGGQQLDDSERRAYQNGLFTLSEIAYDKQHHRVVVSYSFVCGELCGHGETLVLEKEGGKWKVSRMCGEWVS